MRISDWSSDVCSSDLFAFQQFKADVLARDRQQFVLQQQATGHVDQGERVANQALDADIDQCLHQHTGGGRIAVADVGMMIGQWGTKQQFVAEQLRSEEHTSELQSLMRISYAVFCLKKKNNK